MNKSITITANTIIQVVVSLFLVIGSNIRVAESFPLKPLNMKLQRILDTSDDDNNNMDKSRRSSLLQIIPYCTILLPILTISSQPIPTNAIEFVPPSPYFTGTYQSAIEIVYAQRAAVDNIDKVITDGKLDEAAFKVMQLSAQTRMGGKIILDTFQEKIALSKDSSSDVTLLRFLDCQKKFVTLLDLSDEFEISLQSALKGKLGSTTAAQMKMLSLVDETKHSFDDFLLDVKMIEDILS